jgi:hypothetical protein
MLSQRQLEYQAYLSTEHWKNKRQEVLSIRGCKCEKCGEWGNEIHHLSYDNLWKEPLNDLQVLCDDCHEATHRALKSLNKKDQYIHKKKKIHRRAIAAALSRKQKELIIKSFYLTDEELYAYILYSNDKNHYPIIKFASELLGFNGFHPKIVKQSRKNNIDPYKNKPTRKPLRLI